MIQIGWKMRRESSVTFSKNSIRRRRTPSYETGVGPQSLQVGRPTSGTWHVQEDAIWRPQVPGLLLRPNSFCVRSPGLTDSSHLVNLQINLPPLDVKSICIWRDLLGKTIFRKSGPNVNSKRAEEMHRARDRSNTSTPENLQWRIRRGQ